MKINKYQNKLGIVIPAIYLCPCRCVNNIGIEKIMKTLTQNSKGQFIVTENGLLVNSIAVSVYDRLVGILSNCPNVDRMPIDKEPEGVAVFYGQIPYID